MTDAGKLVCKAGGQDAGRLCFKASGADAGKLVYKSEPHPGDATVSVEFDPKSWTCLTYGADHNVELEIAPSWLDSAFDISSMSSFSLPYSSIASGAALDIGLGALTHCDAGIYPAITAMVVIQQENVGTFAVEVNLTVGTQSTVSITTSGGRITALN